MKITTEIFKNINAKVFLFHLLASKQYHLSFKKIVYQIIFCGVSLLCVMSSKSSPCGYR